MWTTHPPSTVPSSHTPNAGATGGSSPMAIATQLVKPTPGVPQFGVPLPQAAANLKVLPAKHVGNWVLMRKNTPLSSTSGSGVAVRTGPSGVAGEHGGTGPTPAKYRRNLMAF